MSSLSKFQPVHKTLSRQSLKNTTIRPFYLLASPLSSPSSLLHSNPLQSPPPRRSISRYLKLSNLPHPTPKSLASVLKSHGPVQVVSELHHNSKSTLLVKYKTGESAKRGGRSQRRDGG